MTTLPCGKLVDVSQAGRSREMQAAAQRSRDHLYSETMRLTLIRFHHDAAHKAEDEVTGNARLAVSRYVSTHPTHTLGLDQSRPDDI